MLPDNPLEPLVLADGTKIDPSSGKQIKDVKRFVEIPSAKEAQAIVAKTKRTVADLPLPNQQMSAVSLCIFYTMYGLADTDIAIVTGLSVPQIKNIKSLDEYRDIATSIRESVLTHEAEDVREFFQQRALGAAKKIVDIAETEDGALGFKASQDILDRAGHRPADIVQHKHEMSGGLRIEFIKRENRDDLPVIDVDYKELN